MSRRDDSALRRHVVDMLRGGGAHVDTASAFRGVPARLRGEKPPGAPHTAWQLLEHMRIAQWDILEFSRNPNHVSPEFPSGYWPRNRVPTHPQAWSKSLRAFKEGLKQIEKLVADPSADLFAPIPRGTGQTILREALLVADHNAYHLGQLVLLRRLLGTWRD